MKNKILIGSIIAVVMLVLLSIAPSINASVKRDNEYYEKIIETGEKSYITNSNCLIEGEITNAVIFGRPFLYLYSLSPPLLFGSLWWIFNDFYNLNGNDIFSRISITHDSTFGNPQWSQGWIWTDGDNGIQEGSGGYLIGRTGYLNILQSTFDHTTYHIGVEGFRGYHITGFDGVTYFKGYAEGVEINYW